MDSWIKQAHAFHSRRQLFMSTVEVGVIVSYFDLHGMA